MRRSNMDVSEPTPIAILYHDDDYGMVQEAKAREQLENFGSEMPVPTLEQGFSSITLPSVVDVPSTTDVLGVLLGDVEFRVDYKPATRCSLEDVGQIADFFMALQCLTEIESEFINEVHHLMPAVAPVVNMLVPEDGGPTLVAWGSLLDPEVGIPMMREFRSRVSQELKERIQQKREQST
jgi:hypothetical protein